MSICVSVVIIGGVKSIAKVASKLIPFMAITYVLAALFIVLINFEKMPGVVTLIIDSAFNGAAASGGFLGASVWMAIRMGFARGIFSNEAGLGSAPIAHAAAKTSNPVNQGMIAMLGVFIDTIIICSLTAFVILLTGAFESGHEGASMTSLAFSTALYGYCLLYTSPSPRD